jgi:16S rRNA (guanine527-N7)-methyltransferase
VKPLTHGEREPPLVADLFGTNVAIVRRFEENLRRHGEKRGLIGPLESSRLWSRHLVNCALLAPFFHSGKVADVGSGAGFPGLVLAILRPEISFVLIESMQRRAEWLREQVNELGLKNTTIFNGRSEKIHVDDCEYVTARAVSALRKLIPLTAPLVREGGELLLIKGKGVQNELDAATKEIRQYRITQIEIVELGRGIIDQPTRVLRARVGGKCGSSVQ